jgi:tetratricopeptide (TPR) repeat protein
MGGDGCGHVLVTSRIQHYDWTVRGSSLTLDCFETRDSVNYLQQTLGILLVHTTTNPQNYDENTLNELSLRMGNLPLALSIAVAYMVRCDVSPADYLSHVKHHSSGGNMDAISASLNVTLERIGEECESAALVLPCLGYFAPDNISKEIIQLFLLTAYYNEDGPQPERVHHLLEVFADHNNHEINNEEKSSHLLNIVEIDFTVTIFVISFLWMVVLWRGHHDVYFGVNETNGTPFFTFSTGVITGCLLMIDLMAMLFWMHPQYHLCIESSGRSDGITNGEAKITTSLEESSSLPLPPTSQDPNQRYKLCLSLMDGRHTCQISPKVTTETDTIWEIMKQFSLLSIRGGKGKGAVHRLQQAVLRASHDDSSPSSHVGLSQKVLCIERCIWVLSKMWKFSKNDSLSWQQAGDTIEHIQVIAKHAMDLLPSGVNDEDGDETSVPMIRVEYYLLLSVLLKEGGVYISMVLSRFDSAQQLLEWSHNIQTHLLQTVSSPSCEDARSLPLDFKVNFLEKLNDCLAVTLYVLGKIMRYNDQLVESEFVLKQSLELRKRHFSAATASSDNRSMNSNNGAIADILHELGVLHLRKHDLYTAKSFLSRSLNMKYEHEEEILETDESSTLHQLGVVATLERRYDDAEALLLQALEFQNQSSSSYSHETPNYGSDRTNQRQKSSSSMTSKAATLQQLGRVELRRGRLSQADSFLSEALQIYLVAYGESRAASHVNVAGVRHQLGAAAMAAKDYHKACEHFSIALAGREIICSQSSGGNDQVISELLALGQAEVERGQHNVAETLFLRAKASIELDLSTTIMGGSATSVCEEKDYTRTVNSLNGAEWGKENYSSTMLSKCGYGNSQPNSDDSVSLERKRDALVKQLFFCVHLLRGVARQRSDTEAILQYTAELKGLSKKYPSHHFAKTHKSRPHENENNNEAAKTTLSSSELTGKTDPHPSSVEYNEKIGRFQSGGSFGFSDEVSSSESSCLSDLYFRHHANGASSSPVDPDLADVISRIVQIRCNIRQLCKVMQRSTKEHPSAEHSLQDILTTVCDALRHETNSLLATTTNESEAGRIHLTVKTFVAAVASQAASPQSCPLKSVLSMLYSLSDDLRSDVRSCGFYLEDL